MAVTASIERFMHTATRVPGPTPSSTSRFGRSCDVALQGRECQQTIALPQRDTVGRPCCLPLEPFQHRDWRAGGRAAVPLNRTRRVSRSSGVRTSTPAMVASTSARSSVEDALKVRQQTGAPRRARTSASFTSKWSVYRPVASKSCTCRRTACTSSLWPE